MKKKLGLFFSLLFSGIFLASCSGSSIEDYSIQRIDNPAASVKEAYSLDLLTTDTTRTPIYKEVSTESTDYYTIYRATNDKLFNVSASTDEAKTYSLFKYTVSLTANPAKAKDDNANNEEVSYNFFKEHGNKVKSVTSNALFFNKPSTTNGIYSQEQTALLKYLFADANTTLANLPLPTSKTITLQSTSLLNTLDITCGNFYYNANQNEEILFETIYLPIYFTRFKDTQIVLQAYAFIPVYSQLINSAGKVIVMNETNDGYVLQDNAFTFMKSIDINTVDTFVVKSTGL
ncbi:MAG: hypothetical protein IJR67_00685 [Acholeplasmatales bacterium]|nr:hypothetical protein [Acholeplasmatales bacterium]